MKQAGKVRIAWLLWIASTALIAGVLAASLFMTEGAADRPLLAQVRAQFLPGKTTAGHYQIELACESCHTKSFADTESIQAACVGCHGQELKEADDKHPLAKFTDPRNAALLEKIDARLCATCHVEHRPEITHAMGVTQPRDFCFHCHQNIAADRPSHKGMGFETCASAGCHNFHDNRALYEDFLLKHAGEAQNLGAQALKLTNFREIAALLPDYPSDRHPVEALDASRADAPAERRNEASIMNGWLASGHAAAGVNCSGCHGEPQSTAWIERPTQEVCAGCHQLEDASFQQGKHGMRLAQGLSPMTPAMARQPMKPAAAHTELTCTTCHGAHRFAVKQAAVKACLDCHDDEHSLAYKDSPHAELWRKELSGEAPAGSGVSCASCHMPRLEHRYDDYDLKQVFVQHNQNDTLRPNEKMIRPVCMNCHGYEFAVDALADAQLIRSNFKGSPNRHVAGVEMAVNRDRQIAAERRRIASSTAP